MIPSNSYCRFVRLYQKCSIEIETCWLWGLFDYSELTWCTMLLESAITKMGVLLPWGDGHGQQQYSFYQYSFGIKGHQVCYENIPLKPLFWHHQSELLIQGRLDPYFRAVYAKFWAYHMNIPADFQAKVFNNLVYYTEITTETKSINLLWKLTKLMWGKIKLQEDRYKWIQSKLW